MKAVQELKPPGISSVNRRAEVLSKTQANSIPQNIRERLGLDSAGFVERIQRWLNVSGNYNT